MPFVTLFSADRLITNADGVVVVASDGIVHVSRDILVASAGGSAQEGIQVDGTDVKVSVAGEVVGNIGVLFNGSGGEANIADGGVISGATNAIRVIVPTSILNSGTLIGGGTTISATAFVEIDNHGDILGEVGISATGAVVLDNFGYIAGNLLLGSSPDSIDSSGGIIAGAASLGGGDDIYIGGAGRDQVTDGAGEDEVSLGGGDDRMSVFNDNASDVFDGGDGRDTLLILNNAAPAVVNLARGTLSSVGSGTNLIADFEVFQLTQLGDSFFADATANVVHGGNGNDNLQLQGGNDRGFGQAGSDTLAASDGNDRLSGGAGNDTMNGGNGIDTLRGGTGFDAMTGGADGDLFLFAAAAELQPVAVGAPFDRITDFVSGNDRIDVFGIDALTATGADDAFVFRGTAALNGAGQVSVRQAAGNTFVDFSLTSASDVVTLQIDGLVTLTVSDFVL